MTALLHRSAFRELFVLAWPIAVSSVSYALMSLCDTIFMARVSAAALAGVGLASLLLFTLVRFAVGVLRGQKTLVSQAVGANATSHFGELLAAGFWMTLGLGLASLAFGWSLQWCLDPLAASPEAAVAARDYFSVRLWGMPIFLFAVLFRQHRYGLGDTRQPMRAAVVGNLSNIALDSLFILGLGMDASGAAMASVLASVLEVGVVWYGLAPIGAAMRYGVRRLRQLWQIGWPIGLQDLVDVGSFATMTAIISSISEADMAAHQLALQSFQLAFLPCFALGEAASIQAGNAVGAGRERDVVVVAGRALIAAAVYAAVFSVLLLTSAGLLASLLAGPGQVADIAGGLLRLSGGFLLVDAAALVALGALRGAGDVRAPALVVVGCAWVFTPPSAWFFGVFLELGALGGWLGLTMELAAVSALLWRRLLSGGYRAAARASLRSLDGNRVC